MIKYEGSYKNKDFNGKVDYDCKSFSQLIREASALILQISTDFNRVEAIDFICRCKNFLDLYLESALGYICFSEEGGAEVSEDGDWLRR